MHRKRSLTSLTGLRAAALAVALAATGWTSAGAQPTTARGTELGAFASAWSHVNAYTATVTMFEQSGDRTQSTVLDYSFRRPNDVTIHFTEGKNAGVTLTWNGGDTVVAKRGSGLMALFRKTFGLHDPQATTVRGSSVDELSFGAILEHAQSTPGILSANPGLASGDASTVAVTLIPASPAADTQLTREVVELSAATHLPLRVLGYEGATLVRSIQITNLKLGS